MKFLKKLALLPATGLSIALLLAPAVSRAQMEVGVMGIYQNGKEVGKIYVPPRSSKDDTYVEHWVLYPGYVYPGKKTAGFETVIVALDETFPSLAGLGKAFRWNPAVG